MSGEVSQAARVALETEAKAAVEARFARRLASEDQRNGYEVGYYEALLALATRQQPEAGREEWLHPATAPKDGTIIELVVDYTDGHGPLHDALIAPTIGWNDLANTGEDKWHIVGWDWCQDHIRDGAGLIRAWRPSRLNASDDALGPLPIIDGEKA